MLELVVISLVVRSANTIFEVHKWHFGDVAILVIYPFTSYL